MCIFPNFSNINFRNIWQTGDGNLNDWPLCIDSVADFSIEESVSLLTDNFELAFGDKLSILELSSVSLYESSSESCPSDLFLGSQVILFSFLSLRLAFANQVDTLQFNHCIKCIQVAIMCNYLSQSHFSDDGQHYFLAFGWIRIFAMLTEPCFQSCGWISGHVLSSGHSIHRAVAFVIRVVNGVIEIARRRLRQCWSPSIAVGVFQVVRVRLFPRDTRLICFIHLELDFH